jgi:EAL domain-containing protein (putative c-di-GMP-specific phosphodiesterase class I)/PAS domain-containing protein
MKTHRLRGWIIALLPVGLCLVLLGMIFLSLFDWQWLAFLSGIFLAAIVALSSKATSTEWLLARRAKQLEKLKAKLSAQTTLIRGVTENLADSESRNRLLFDSVDYLLVYMDAAQICLFHNLAFASAVGTPESKISGRSLRDILGDDAYSRIRVVVERVLDGKDGDFEKTICLSQTGSVPYAIRLIPDSRPNRMMLGCWLVMSEVDIFDAGAAQTPSLRGQAAIKSPAASQSAAGDDSAEQYYLQSMAEDLTGWTDPKARLLEALEKNQFRLLYQTIRPAAAAVVGPVYAEILVRLEEEEQNLLPPGAFFPVAERFHLMSALDRWVVTNLLSWYRFKRRSGVFTRFCVNLSNDSIVDETFVEFLGNEIERNEVPGIVVCFELAEADVISHQIDAIRLTGELAAIGCEVTIDGFGGSSSSFTYLQDMAVNFLKIDRSIIANIHRDPVSLAKAKAISRAAHLTKRYTIAECVETQDTLDILREFGVDYVQGFGIARPRALSELERNENGSDAVGIAPVTGHDPVQQVLKELELSTTYASASEGRKPSVDSKVYDGSR